MPRELSIEVDLIPSVAAVESPTDVVPRPMSEFLHPNLEVGLVPESSPGEQLCPRGAPVGLLPILGTLDRALIIRLLLPIAVGPRTGLSAHIEVVDVFPIAGCEGIQMWYFSYKRIKTNEDVLFHMSDSCL